MMPRPRMSSPNSKKRVLRSVLDAAVGTTSAGTFMPVATGTAPNVTC
jgi:hypothetical protein